MVAQLRNPQAAFVLVRGEQVFAALGVGQVVVHVGAAAGSVGKWLGHERSDGTVFSRRFAGQHLEEDEAVGRGQGVGILEIYFVLRVGVFVVRLVNAPAQLAEGVIHVTQV